MLFCYAVLMLPLFPEDTMYSDDPMLPDDAVRQTGGIPVAAHNHDVPADKESSGAPCGQSAGESVGNVSPLARPLNGGEAPVAPATPVAVAIARCPRYDRELVIRSVAEVLQAAGIAPVAGTRVLVKPNLLKVQPGGLCCTHPEVVRAACIYLRECGCHVTVGDSPAFGSAVQVARAIGLDAALADLAIPVITLDNAVRTVLPCGLAAGISRHALEADALLSVPRVKAHTQMRLTLSVKNMFGCVSGVRKAIAHTAHGDKGNAFRALLVEVAQMLPPTVALADGIVAMDRNGPAGGDAYPLGIVAAAADTVALDTALYAVVGAGPDQVPLWGELRAREIWGADAAHLSFPLLRPDDVAVSDFRLPGTLSPETFHPLRLVRSSLKRLWISRKG